MKRNILLLAVFAGVLGLTSCKSKKNKQVQEVVVVEEVAPVEEVVVKEKVLAPEVVKTAEGVKIIIPSDLLFAFDSYSLTNHEMSELDKFAVLLNQKGNLNKQIRIDGYTDSIGTVQYNETLSVKRANSVKEYLQKSGVSPSRMTTKGYGKSNPVADNKTAEGRQKNRRVEIVILN